MSSHFQDVVDAIIADLTLHVASLPASTTVIHRYTPWDPEELKADNRRHLAVWPTSAAMASNPIANESHELVQFYNILVWENGQEGSRGVRDETGAATFFGVHDDILARFYLTSNENTGSSEQCWYISTTLPENIAQARWFGITVRVIHYTGFS